MNSPKVPFTLSAESISFFANGRMYNVSVREDKALYRDVLSLVENDDHTVDNMVALVDKVTRVEEACEGLVSITKGVVYFDGEAVYNTLAAKLLALVEQGVSAKPWMRFMNNVMDNPSYKSRKALYDFLDHFDTPITEDGHFLAFKRVGPDFKDIYTGTMDNSPGTVVTMPREKVDDDSNVTCSAGLHACASNYLTDSGYGNTYGAKVVVVKINPRDVVAVPHDYKYSKMRVCRYEVLSEAEEDTMHRLSSGHFTTYDTKGVDSFEDEWDEYFGEDDEYDDDYDW